MCLMIVAAPSKAEDTNTVTAPTGKSVAAALRKPPMD